MISAALKKAGLKKSEVSSYVFRDEYGVNGRYAPRTKALKFAMYVTFEDDSYTVERVWVNALNEVIIEYKSKFI